MADKKVWKNIDWKNKEEKEAFYNKYFKKSEFAADEAKRRIDQFKQSILGFIERNEVIEGKNKRQVTIKDIEKFIKEKD